VDFKPLVIPTFHGPSLLLTLTSDNGCEVEIVANFNNKQVKTREKQERVQISKPISETTWTRKLALEEVKQALLTPAREDQWLQRMRDLQQSRKFRSKYSTNEADFNQKLKNELRYWH
jgi:hypothetical protein